MVDLPPPKSKLIRRLFLSEAGVETPASLFGEPSPAHPCSLSLAAPARPGGLPFG